MRRGSPSVTVAWLLLTCALPLASPLQQRAQPDVQQVLGEEPEWTTFRKPIKRVAVIGAGPAGLQVAATLQEHNFTTRLFERAEGPGGNWLYSELTPVREAYPNKPIDEAGYERDIRPDNTTIYYKDGDDGLTLEERWREAVRPSPIWDSLHTNSPTAITSLPGILYPKYAPWIPSGHLIQRHVRAYAAAHGLNANDLPAVASEMPVTSYGTRVELLQKDGDKWVLHLRKLERLPHSKQIKADWWTEEFDAVVCATGSYDEAYVPNIKGLAAWAEVKKDGKYPVWHSQHYRLPGALTGKTVLILGGSVSASEISRDVGPVVKQLYVSMKEHPDPTVMQRRSYKRIHGDAGILPEIAEFLPLEGDDIRTGQIRLKNGTVISGIDEIILGTGYRRANPFLRDYTSPMESDAAGSSDAKSHPIITDGRALSSLHWTGHYIPDPTLAFTTLRPWTIGEYQSLAFAKVWEGTARLPSESRMWAQYPGDRASYFAGQVGTLQSEAAFRQYVAWLNSESLLHGGRFVDFYPIQTREIFTYYSDVAWEDHYVTLQNFTDIDNTPSSQWEPGQGGPPRVAFWDAYVQEHTEW